VLEPAGAVDASMSFGAGVLEPLEVVARPARGRRRFTRSLDRHVLARGGREKPGVGESSPLICRGEANHRQLPLVHLRRARSGWRETVFSAIHPLVLDLASSFNCVLTGSVAQRWLASSRRSLCLAPFRGVATHSGSAGPLAAASLAAIPSTLGRDGSCDPTGEREHPCYDAPRPLRPTGSLSWRPRSSDCSRVLSR